MDTNHPILVDMGVRPSSRIVKHIIAARKSGMTDEDIACENDNINLPITLNDLHLLHICPDLQYHYKHAIAKVAWESASKMKCEIATLSARDDVMKDILNNTLDIVKMTTEMNKI
jgi:uncharacterized Zn finger protein